MVQQSASVRSIPRLLLAILGVAWILRVVIVLRGGQLFFPDEMLYRSSQDIAFKMAGGHLGGALASLLSSYRHIGFVIVGVVPAALQGLLKLTLDVPLSQSLWVPSLLLSLASVASIALVYAIARRSGAPVAEALLAAGLLATATSNFYWARHFMPYDLALALALCSLWVGLVRTPSLARSFAVGLLAGGAFLVYNGYWMVAAAALVVHVLYGQRRPSALAGRMLAAGLGLAMLPLALTFVSIAAHAKLNYIQGLIRFSASISQGDFSEGWKLPWLYLWDAERAMSLVWLGGGVAAVYFFVRRRKEAHWHALLWLSMAVGLYVLLALLSTVMHQFVVYGRLVRQLVPFICLAAACGYTQLFQAWSPRRAIVVSAAVALVLLAALNFLQPIRQAWPIDIIRSAVVTYGDVSREMAIAGPQPGPRLLVEDMLEMPPPAPEPTRYVLVNVDYFYPLEGPRAVSAGISNQPVTRTWYRAAAFRMPWRC